MANEFFTGYQQQFDESQKRFVTLWDESQKQLIESQQKLVTLWMESFTSHTYPMSISNNFEKTLNVQQELIHSALKAQKVAVELSIETQKQFWDSYFQTTQKMLQEMPKPFN